MRRTCTPTETEPPQAAGSELGTNGRSALRAALRAALRIRFAWAVLGVDVRRELAMSIDLAAGSTVRYRAAYSGTVVVCRPVPTQTSSAIAFAFRVGCNCSDS